VKTLIFDTETTGLPLWDQPYGAPAQPRLASISAALVELVPHPNDPTIPTAEVQDHFHLKLQPDWSDAVRAASAAGFAINHLSLEELERDGVQLSDALTVLLMLWIKAGQTAAYGVDFDIWVIHNEAMHVTHRLFGALIEQFAKPQVCIRTAVVNLCKMAPTEKMQQWGRAHQHKTPKLSEAVEILLGKTMEGGHDAMIDLRWTIKLWGHLARRGLVT
jgi:DNA polymerase-3 subunit epsilon